MYVYYNKKGILKAVDSSPIMQGSMFDLTLLFDEDYDLNGKSLTCLFKDANHDFSDLEKVYVSSPIISDNLMVFTPKDSYIDFDEISTKKKYKYATCKISSSSGVTNNSGLNQLCVKIGQGSESIYLGVLNFYVEKTLGDNASCTKNYLEVIQEIKNLFVISEEDWEEIRREE